MFCNNSTISCFCVDDGNGELSICSATIIFVVFDTQLSVTTCTNSCTSSCFFVLSETEVIVVITSLVASFFISVDVIFEEITSEIIFSTIVSFCVLVKTFHDV
jgi:hypothetical protein